MKKKMEQKPVPHVLIFPFPAQGHVNSMLKLAELLCLSQLHVTFLNTTYYHHRLLQFTDAGTRFSRFPNFRFQTISDGLPDHHSRSFADHNDIINGINLVTKPSLQQLLISDSLRQVTSMIYDEFLIFPLHIAKELGIPSIAFRTSSPCSLLAIFHFRTLVESGELPFPDTDMDKLVTCIPGMECVLRRRDLPSAYRAKDLTNPFLELVTTATSISIQASAFILNTFEDLDEPILSQLRIHFPIIYTIGPLHALLSSRVSFTSSSVSVSPSNSLREVDRSCMTWLDSQPSNSVVYVSFGSLVVMSQKEKLEFWHGLVNSGKRFLWVVRPDSVVDNEEKFEIPAELREGTEDRGYMVGWCPQEEVLVHPAVGGFMTHSGWNSTLESIIAGVPMVCWPYLGDQLINSRFVSEVWKVGIDMKDTCNRSIVEKMVNDLMVHKRDELKRSMDQVSNQAMESVSPGGTSYCNMDKLIEDIKAMNFKV